MVLVVFSLFFYFAEEGLFTIILLGSIAISFFFGLLLNGAKNVPKRPLLLLGLGINLGLLFLFKYYNFFYFNILGTKPEPGIALLLGISFFTFQGVSYLIDCYRGHVKPCTNILTFTCYICMFPQLVAGPIIRYKEISTNLTARVISQSDLIHGLQRFCIGLFKKVVIADHLAIIADFVFDSQGNFHASAAWLGLFAFTLQIYFDFSGYSDMATGMGRMLGFKFPENFDFPFVTTSIRDFWRKWHMTLTHWFRDYVFIPLGGSRVSLLRNLVNILIVFALTGFWHGAQWTFLVWGLLHGAIMCIERLIKKPLKNRLRPIYIAFNFLIVTMLFGVFRVQDLNQIHEYASNLINFYSYANMEAWALVDNFKMFILALSIFISFRFWKPVASVFSRYININSTWFTLASAFALLCLSIIELSTASYTPFLYFKF